MTDKISNFEEALANLEGVLAEVEAGIKIRTTHVPENQPPIDLD
jgi:hypothetical protein